MLRLQAQRTVVASDLFRWPGAPFAESGDPEQSCNPGHRVIHGSWFLKNSLSLVLTRTAVDVLVDESWHDLTLDDALLPRTLSIDA
jgi:hypothetical protein